jgi:3-polyprenyl-4-hydroxybenzoate decarboxylase
MPATIFQHAMEWAALGQMTALKKVVVKVRYEVDRKEARDMIEYMRRRTGLDLDVRAMDNTMTYKPLP